jgi:tetratricopeptide (TPR) repeat protein
MKTKLEVFVSSSMKEFRAERAMLRDLIPRLSQGVTELDAWVYEDDAYASDDTIQHVYRRHLQNSELYIGIFGKHYGKYTIDEFNTATDWGLPRHIYVQILGEGEQRDPELEDFLRRISDVEHGLAPRWFRDIQDLWEGVKTSLEHWLTNRILHRSGSTSAVLATHKGMLEDLPRKLIGREGLIQQINPLIDQGETVLLQGLGGMGKTALAATLAAQRIGEHPVLWQRMGSESTDVLFEAIARPFNAHQSIAAAQDDEKRRIINHLLLSAGVCLVVLDDAWDGSALSTVLRAIPRSIPVLVTSRHRYGIQKVVKVGELTPDKAVETLGNYAGRDYVNDPEAMVLCKILGYHPFALEVAGRTMNSADLMPAELLRRIADNPTDLEVPEDFAEEGRRTVSDLLNTSLTMLDNETQRVFFAMGAFFAKQMTAEMLALYFTDIPEVPDHMLAQVRAGVPEVADLSNDELRLEIFRLTILPQLEVDSSPVEAALDTLVRRGLVERERESQHHVRYYRLHDLAYSYAKSKNGDQNRRRALTACLVYTQRYNQPNPANFTALRPELDNLMNAAAWALEVGAYAEAERFAWNLYAQGSEFLDYDGLYTPAIRLLEQGIQAAERQRNRRNQGVHLTHLGLCYEALGQYQKAINCYEQALAIDRELANRRDEGADLGNLGNIYSDLGQYNKAIYYYKHSLAIARELGDRQREGSLLGNLGSAHSDLGQYEQALTYYEQALTIAHEIEDRRGEGSRLGNLGTTYSNLGQIEKAIGYYEQSLTIAREIGDRSAECVRLGNLGNAYRRLKQYDKALPYYQQSLAIAQEIGNRSDQGYGLWQIGHYYYETGDLRAALDCYQQARAIFAEIGAQHRVQDVEHSIAYVQDELAGGR